MKTITIIIAAILLSGCAKETPPAPISIYIKSDVQGAWYAMYIPTLHGEVTVTSAQMYRGTTIDHVKRGEGTYYFRKLSETAYGTCKATVNGNPVFQISIDTIGKEKKGTFAIP